MPITIFYVFVIIFVSSPITSEKSVGILYPRSSETRDILSLDGLWNFAGLNNQNPERGELEEWYKKDLKQLKTIDVTLMPVPASYNDIGVESELRDYVGTVWYQRHFFIPKLWKGQKVWLRFGSVCRGAVVWINDEKMVTHDIGHLPFLVEVTKVVNYGADNRISVAVDNTLSSTTIPQGSIIKLSSGRLKLQYTFDFLNYAGIDRSVILYTTPAFAYINDITISTDVNGANGLVSYEIDVVTCAECSAQVKVTLLDHEDKEVASNTNWKAVLTIVNASFWWPYLMHPEPGYLYTLQVELLNKSTNALIDIYRQRVGIRKLFWDDKSLQINNKPVYLRGFGRHEDSDIRGKGVDLPLIIRDYNLIKWIGANAYRTSHYPYAEEIMDLADEMGIMIIDECPSVDTEQFSEELLTNHEKALTELIQRDKNRPSVILWSLANEPRTQFPEAKDYFKKIVAHAKGLDATRPVTVVNNQLPNNDLSGEFLDILSFNVYSAWYSNTGDTDVIVHEVTNRAQDWYNKHKKPVLVAEYGADTMEGLHMLPAFVWSEEYQDEYLSKHFEAFDELREKEFFIGEMIWNFADFKTAQSTTRVGGNKKGVFTRNRQPKASAHLLRKRYWSLAQQLDNATLPKCLNPQVIKNYKNKDEL